MKLTQEQKTELWDLCMIYGEHKDPHGYTAKEIEVLQEEVEKRFGKVNPDYFSKAMMGNTGMMNEEKEFINYPIDVYKAFLAGLEGRGLSILEWD